jgi:hypothetical protein
MEDNVNKLNGISNFGYGIPEGVEVQAGVTDVPGAVQPNEPQERADEAADAVEEPAESMEEVKVEIIKKKKK